MSDDKPEPKVVTYAVNSYAEIAQRLKEIEAERQKPKNDSAVTAGSFWRTI